MILLLAGLAGAVVFGVGMSIGYFSGRSRASEYDAIKKAEYKEMSRDLAKATKAENEYESALRDISTGRGGAPEITAAAALNVIRQYKELS
jgi:hypothetical protein